MSQPFFSILIPCYNAENYINIALDSCINQKFQDFEIILADNGSDDKTKKYLEQVNNMKFKFFLGEKRINDIDLRNFLIKKAQGKYIVWLEPFDKLTPFFLDEAYKILINQHYDILEFSMMWTYENGKLDVSSISNCEYINNNCAELYLERIDSLQDIFAGKVFSNDLMKKSIILPVDNVYEYAECFYSLPLYLFANSYKSFSEIFVYDYRVDLKRNKTLEDVNLENIKNICKIRNEQLNRNIKLLKDNNLYEKYALSILNKLYLYNIFQDMMCLEKIEERKEAFKEFYKYFTIQLSANIFVEDDYESN